MLRRGGPARAFYDRRRAAGDSHHKAPEPSAIAGSASCTAASTTGPATTRTPPGATDSTPTSSKSREQLDSYNLGVSDRIGAGVIARAVCLRRCDPGLVGMPMRFDQVRLNRVFRSVMVVCALATGCSEGNSTAECPDQRTRSTVSSRYRTTTRSFHRVRRAHSSWELTVVSGSLVVRSTAPAG
jgi:hypothetical protein